MSLNLFMVIYVYSFVVIGLFAFFISNTEPIHGLKFKDITLMHILSMIIVSVFWLPILCIGFLVRLFFKK